ncbi:hypothetical protein GA0070607_2566 [Micromonospora coriariae]|uniref:Uncharacterized protein n=1 Tax=Micromonospora coriariae TaxID=285665 RepID=A0A1C4VSH9_9ACTN|nr:hypothetical protein GA0070607_2566 [Micromonospora coriariae]
MPSAWSWSSSARQLDRSRPVRSSPPRWLPRVAPRLSAWELSIPACLLGWRPALVGLRGLGRPLLSWLNGTLMAHVWSSPMHRMISLRFEHDRIGAGPSIRRSGDPMDPRNRAGAWAVIAFREVPDATPTHLGCPCRFRGGGDPRHRSSLRLVGTRATTRSGRARTADPVRPGHGAPVHSPGPRHFCIRGRARTDHGDRVRRVPLPGSRQGSAAHPSGVPPGLPRRPPCRAVQIPYLRQRRAVA